MSDFSIAYQALRTQAQVHGLDPNTEPLRTFLEHVAEVGAQQHVEARNAMHYLHTLEHRLGDNVDVEV